MRQLHWKTAFATALCAAAFSQRGLAQAVSASILQINAENWVQYVDDVGDPSKFATNADVTTARPPINFAKSVCIGDIEAVNGQPAKGTLNRFTQQKPAHGGEILISLATGMGPTRPGVDPGQPFPTWPDHPLQQINSPVSVTVNGRSADVINAIGWPRLVARYRVDFRVPNGTASGIAAVQLSAAWIQGPTVNIPIQ